MVTFSAMFTTMNCFTLGIIKMLNSIQEEGKLKLHEKSDTAFLPRKYVGLNLVSFKQCFV